MDNFKFIRLDIENTDPEPVYDFSTEEQLVVHVDPNEYTFGVDVISVVTPDGKIPGWASCEYETSNCLNYMLSAVATLPKESGYYIVEGVTGYYIRGDGWTTDDDAEMSIKLMRPITEQEQGWYI